MCKKDMIIGEKLNKMCRNTTNITIIICELCLIGNDIVIEISIL